MVKLSTSIFFFCNFLFSQVTSGIVTYSILDVQKLSNYDSIFRTEKAIEFTKLLRFHLKFDGENASFTTARGAQMITEIEDNLLNVSTVRGTYIKNFANNKIVRYYEYEDIGGKMAIENTNDIKWNYLNEKKLISGYECYLAEGVFTDYIERFIKNYKVRAWYCPKIPVSIGPKYYHGLPGLIMEITDDKVTFGVSKITFIEDLIIDNIKNQKEYKKITDKEFNVVIAKYVEDILKN